MKVQFEIEIQEAANPDRICTGCALRVGKLLCQNRKLCPSTEGKKLNYKQISRLEKVAD